MNINTLRKNYDKLQPVERFAALTAALARNDELETNALLQSAPSIRFSAPNTYGLSQAFSFLSMWHSMTLLGYAATFFYLATMEDDPMTFQFGDQSHSVSDALSLLQQRVLEKCEAWRAVCQEYGVDSQAWLKHCPYTDLIYMTETIMRLMNQRTPAELVDLEKATKEYRDVIETNRKEWE